MSEKKINFAAGWRGLVVAALDAGSIVVATYLSLLIRFDFKVSLVPEVYFYFNARILPILIITHIALYFVFRLYHSIWRYAGETEVVKATLCFAVLIPIYIVEYIVFAKTVDYLPRSYFVMTFILSYIGCVGIRLSYRAIRSLRYNFGPDSTKFDRVMVIGGGSAGRIIIRELKNAPEIMGKPVCIIDDNKEKWHRSLEGVPIVGGRYDIPDMVEKYKVDRIIYAIARVDVKDRREILHICNDTGVHTKVVPALYQIINGEIDVTRLKNVDIADLLGRDEIKVNNDEIMQDIGGKVIMVTGGGGSIGSELCRQIAAAGPKQLIIYEIYENNAYAIQQELIRKYPDLDLEVLIGSVRNTNRVEWVLTQFHPDIIYHAAAHKHVPLMEESPNEAIKNNPIGTYKLGVAAAENGVKKFLLISTDKAVNPTNIMGASKRLCEMVVQMLNRRYENTDFVAVRFGNVLGSNGSVIPLFKEQIKNGGPVTVTDKNIIRYFMTIPEAVSLVLQASFYAKGGEIFILDMGDPVRIDDMARNLIRLSGYKPDEDIKIVYTGLRPGEKLYEELLMAEEGMQETANKLIYIGKPIEMDDEEFMKQLIELDNASKNEAKDIKQLVAKVVTTYHPEA